MAKSYYKKIQGVRYDRALLESAEERIKGQGDGRISDQDIHEIIDLSKDGNKVTLTELRTIKYIRDHFRVTEKAQKTLSDFIIQIETLKSVSKEKEDLNITSEDFGSEEKDNDDIKEEISDLINDYLTGSCDLHGELRKLNFDPELLNWWPVNFSAV